MRMRKLGALEVSELGFGILGFASTYSQAPDKAESIRVIRGAHDLGVSSICEFGQSRPELTHVHQAADRRLKDAARKRIGEAQAAGDVDTTLSSEAVAEFLLPTSPASALPPAAAQVGSI